MYAMGGRLQHWWEIFPPCFSHCPGAESSTRACATPTPPPPSQPPRFTIRQKSILHEDRELLTFFGKANRRAFGPTGWVSGQHEHVRGFEGFGSRCPGAASLIRACATPTPPRPNQPLRFIIIHFICFSTAVQDAALTIKREVKSETSQSKSGTSFNLSSSGMLSSLNHSLECDRFVKSQLASHN